MLLDTDANGVMELACGTAEARRSTWALLCRRQVLVEQSEQRAAWPPCSSHSDCTSSSHNALSYYQLTWGELTGTICWETRLSPHSKQYLSNIQFMLKFLDRLCGLDITSIIPKVIYLFLFFSSVRFLIISWSAKRRFLRGLRLLHLNINLFYL